jgi:hypothetical protein
MSEQSACTPAIVSTIRKFACDAHDMVVVHQHGDFLILSFRIRETDPMYNDKFKRIEITYPEAKCLVKLIERATAKLHADTLDIPAKK